MRRLPALVAALLLPAAQPLLLVTALSTASLLVSEAPVQAQSQEAVGKVAQAITVRLETSGAGGSGVLVKRDGNRYTVLTAWHVVSGQRPGEELDIYTSDGQRRLMEQGSIKRLGEVDLAVLTFSSPTAYEVARVGDVKSVAMGSAIFVAGFPLPSSAVPTRLLRLIKGDVIANATVAIPDGYQLLYDNQTLPGVSGGAVLNANGELVGIHGKAEKADQVSERSGKAIATGTNQGVPISYYNQYAAGEAVVASSKQATSADDYLAQARALLGKKGREQEVIRLANQVLAIRQSERAYFYRGIAKTYLGDNQGAIADYNQAIAINPQYADAHYNRGIVKSNLGDNQGAIADYSQVLAINPQFSDAYNNRGKSKSDLGDKQGAIADYNQAIAIDSQNATAYYNLGVAKHQLGDKQGAIIDYSQAIVLNPRYFEALNNRGLAKVALSDNQGAITDFTQAITINPQYADTYTNRGGAKSQLGDKQGAISDFNQAIALNPKHIFAYLNRGIAFEDIADLGRACKDWRMAASLGNAVAADWVRKECQ